MVLVVKKSSCHAVLVMTGRYDFENDLIVLCFILNSIDLSSSSLGLFLDLTRVVIITAQHTTCF